MVIVPQSVCNKELSLLNAIAASCKIYNPMIAAPEGLKELKVKASAELVHILDWWSYRMIDLEQGGFLGRIDGHGIPILQAPKGVILNARILWTFSAAARVYPDRKFYIHLAERAREYFRKNFFDGQHGGVYWMLDAAGSPLETKKQIYAQAFAMYALTENYLLTRDAQILEQSYEFFLEIEKHSRDREKGGYLEAFARDWSALPDVRLSEKDTQAAKTMNTHLHILEAYTNLFRSRPKDDVGDALYKLIRLFLDKFIAAESGHLHLFFDEDWQLKSHEISFGHDIETSWLLVEAAEVLHDETLLVKVQEKALAMAEATLPAYDEDGGIFNSAGPLGIIDRAKEWWPQIEAVIGFVNAWQMSGEPTYLQAAMQSWHFIETKLIDREHGEWYWGLDAQGAPALYQDKAGPWKCPYHNGRGCLEIIRRL